jgi:hypothetical protein
MQEHNKITIEIVHTPIEQALHPFVLPVLHRLLEAENPYDEQHRGDYHTLVDLGLADQGRLLISPDVLLAALNYVSFDEEMSRVGQF